MTAPRLVAFLFLALAGACAAAAPLRVGSKRFTESYVLGEILAQSATRAGDPAEHRPGLGNTAILVEALRRGDIDAYPEYTGTIAREILREPALTGLAALNRALAPMGLEAGFPLGFSNNYALGMREDDAAARGVATISDLARHPGVRPGFSHEFLARADGWPGLAQAYGLAGLAARGLDHGVAYEALASGAVDVIDLYTTDARLEKPGVRVLADDRGFFPRYDAVVLYRREARGAHPAAFAAWSRLAGRIDARTMTALNARVEADRVDTAAAARAFLGGPDGAPPRSLRTALFAPDFWRLAREHALLVLAAVSAAVAAGVPVGIAAARVAPLAQPLLAAAGLAQTIPALALLAFLVPFLGVGAGPALVALFVYSLLPIVRNTHAGLAGVAGAQRQAALALGFTARQSLALVELPLALPTILAGVKTAAVTSVGTATIAAFVGAGGFGERIAQGLAVNDPVLLLAGALPAATLALAVHFAFEAAERAFARR